MVNKVIVRLLAKINNQPIGMEYKCRLNHNNNINKKFEDKMIVKCTKDKAHTDYILNIIYLYSSI